MEALASPLCASTTCFGMSHEAVQEEPYHEPGVGPQQRSIILFDSDDESSSYGSHEQGMAAWYSAHTLSKVPSVIRLDSSSSPPPPPIRESVWIEGDQPGTPIKPLLEPIVIKDADSSTDEETISTQSSYSMSLSSPANGSGEWLNNSSPLQQRSFSRVNWNDAVIEDTTDGIRIHGPPELVLPPTLQAWVSEVPDRP